MALIRRHRCAGAAVGARQRGFSLLEVVIALGVLAFGLLGLAAMQIYSMQAGRQGRNTTAATQVAEDNVEALLHESWTGADLANTVGWQNVATVTRGSTDYVVEKRITDIITGSTKSLDVRVTWNEPKKPNRRLVMSTVRYNY